MSRRNLNAIPSEERTEFFRLIKTYLDESDAAAEHEQHFGMAHEEHFLAWHRYFITKFEAWLATHAGERFIPIPFWNPAYEIPSEFDYPGRNTNNINRPLPAKYTVFGDGTSSLSDFSNYLELNTDIQRWHDGIHGQIGGVMESGRSPEDPVFWPLHAMFDLVWEQWRNIPR